VFCVHPKVTFPIDTTKIRLQIQGQHTKQALKDNKYNGMMDAFTKIVRDEGFRRLYRGLDRPLCPSHFFFFFFFFFFFPPC